MPEMDGVKASETLRQRLGDRCPFLVALTAEALEGDRERFLAKGFDDYMSKPLSPEVLQDLLLSVSLKNENKKSRLSDLN